MINVSGTILITLALKPQPFVEAIDGLVDDSTIKTMEKYFNVHDRNVLLKYLRDTMVAADR